jgi:hypothetical protein
MCYHILSVMNNFNSILGILFNVRLQQLFSIY